MLYFADLLFVYQTLLPFMAPVAERYLWGLVGRSMRIEYPDIKKCSFKPSLPETIIILVICMYILFLRGASHVYNVPSHVYNVPSHVYNVPSHVYNVPSHVYNVPSHAYNVPSTLSQRNRIGY